jgi:hypothetical protein
MQRNSADGAMPQDGTGYDFGVGRTIDLALRFIYVMLAPIMLAPLAALLPITGTLVGAGIATIVALIGGERWHAAVDRIPVLGRLLGGMAKLGDFYREHPPKPLVFYIVYPLLLPVILFRRVPRRELTLYRKVNAIALIVILVGGAWDFFRHWQPELGFGPFFGSMVAGFIIQFFVMFALVMPIVTTVIMLRISKATTTLVALLGVIVLSASIGGIAAHHMKDTVQLSTWERLRYRTREGIGELQRCIAASPTHDEISCAKQNRVLLAMTRGIDAAIATLAGDHGAFDIAQDRARKHIAEFYKPDEARAFKLYADEGVVILYVHHRARQTIWLGFSPGTHKLLLHAADLPQAARTVIGV